MLKLFGLSLTLLNGGPNHQQKAALSDIPETVSALEAHFNLDIEGVLYAVCPKCSFTHPPSCSTDTGDLVYKTGSKRVTAHIDLCGAVLLEDGKLIKLFEYYPFFDYLSHFPT